MKIFEIEVGSLDSPVCLSARIHAESQDLAREKTLDALAKGSKHSGHDGLVYIEEDDEWLFLTFNPRALPPSLFVDVTPILAQLKGK